MVRAWKMEPSAKWGISMEGALLRYEPSMMQSVFVDGSPNSFAKTPESGDTATVGCGQGLWTGFAGRAPGPGYAPMLAAKRRARICTSSLAYGRKTEEAANRHYSGLQPQ